MELSQLLFEALNLMFIGMLFVGTFLGILVFLIPLLNKITPDEATADTTTASPAALSSPPADQETLIAVMSAALQQYRKQHK